jgi:wyosine [tRNA(Phe)-imidazoG37] synthetase (radical SAM superfamily)
MYRYLFGPVASRRFGRSLGVDLLPAKICTFDCIFCEVGRTRDLTVTRREYVPTAEVVSELGRWAASGDKADFITLAGSGEPTLHSGFGDVLAAAGALRVARTALLTNGSLLHIPEVRESAARADVVKVALGAASAREFSALNRPHAAVDLDALIRAGAEFRRHYAGSLWVEVFVVAGVNDSEEMLRPVADRLAGWQPDRIHLNTVARPPADASAAPAAKSDMERLASIFVPKAEVIADFTATRVVGAPPDVQKVAAMLARRPGRSLDVSAAIGMDLAATTAFLEGMVARQILVREDGPDGTYFRARSPSTPPLATEPGKQQK